MKDPLKRTHFFSMYALIVFSLCGAIGCSEKKKEPTKPPPVKVHTATVVQDTVPLYIKSFGVLTSNLTIDIVPQVSEILRRIYINSGQHVEEGALLYEIDQRVFKAEVEKARAQLISSEADLQVSKDKVRRNLELLKSRLISPQDFEILVAQAEEAAQTVNTAKAALEIAELNLSYTVIRAPVKGVCGMINVYAGNYVIAGSTNLITINQLDPILVNFYLPSRDFSRVQKAFVENNGALEVKVAPADAKDPTYYYGTVSVINNQINQNTGTIQLQGSIPNHDYALWAGEFVYGWIKLRELQNVALVYESAVAIGEKGPYAFVVKSDNTVDMRELNVGETLDEKIVVISGLKPGETVVTRGQMNLKPGTEVQVVASDDPTGFVPIKTPSSQPSTTSSKSQS
jgi:multidrug efflux system membrane fusion protein